MYDFDDVFFMLKAQIERHMLKKKIRTSGVHEYMEVQLSDDEDTVDDEKAKDESKTNETSEQNDIELSDSESEIEDTNPSRSTFDPTNNTFHSTPVTPVLSALPCRRSIHKTMPSHSCPQRAKLMQTLMAQSVKRAVARRAEKILGRVNCEEELVLVLKYNHLQRYDTR